MPRSTDIMASLEPGRAYWITYNCSPRHGDDWDEGHDEYVYRGPFDTWGKHQFDPIGGGPAIYLFPDELTDAY